MNKKDILALSDRKLKILYAKTYKDFKQRCKLYNLPSENIRIHQNNNKNKITSKYITSNKYYKNLATDKTYVKVKTTGNIYKQSIPVHIIEELIDDAIELKIMENEIKRRRKIKTKTLDDKKIVITKISPILSRKNIKNMKDIL